MRLGRRLAVISALVLVGSVAVAAAFDAPVDLSTAGDDATGARLAVEPNGGAAAVWRTGRGTAEVAVRPAGGAFGGPEPIGAGSPVVAIDGSARVTVAWINSDGVVQARRLGEADVATLSTPGATDLVMDSDVEGNVTVAWLANGHVQLSTRRAGETAWPPATNVTPDGAQPEAPEIASFRSGGVAVAWEGLGGVTFVVRPSLNESFGAFEVFGDPASQMDLDANDAGISTLAWTTNEGVGAAIHTFQGLDQMLFTGAAGASRPAVGVAPNGSSVVAWIDGQGRAVMADLPIPERDETKRQPAGPATPLSDPGTASEIDVAAGPNGHVAVAWASDAGVRAAFRELGGAFTFATLDGSGTGPEVGIDGIGRTTALWTVGSAGSRVARATNHAPAPQATATPSPSPTPTPTSSAKPEAGKTVTVKPVGGDVLIKFRGTRSFVELDETMTVELGSWLDTTRGRVELTLAQPDGGTESAQFYDGTFKMFQVGKGRRLIHEMRLTAKLPGCRTRKATASARRKRRLWGSGKGRFRTKGRFSAATVRGTRWLVEDRACSTLTRVRQGRVAVRDTVRKRTVIVRAGRSYVARKR